jgi:hypothetical protein
MNLVRFGEERATYMRDLRLDSDDDCEIEWQCHKAMLTYIFGRRFLTRSIACSSSAEFSVQSRMKMFEAAVKFKPVIHVQVDGNEEKVKL